MTAATTASAQRNPTRVCFVVSTCCPAFSAIVDLFLRVGEAARSHGLAPCFVLSGAETCSHIIRLDGDRVRCKAAFGTVLDSLRAAFGAEAVVTPSEDESLSGAVDDAWAHLSGLPHRERVASGVDLYELCRASVARRLRTPPGLLLAPNAAVENQATSEFQRDGLRHLIFYRKMFEKWQPRSVCYFGGHYHQDRAAYVVCRELGIESIAFEASFVPGLLYCDDSGVTGNRGGMARDTRHWHELGDGGRADENCVDELMWRSLALYGEAPTRDASRLAVRQRLGVSSDEQVLLFICQAPFDSSLISDGGDFVNQLSTVLALSHAVERQGTARLLVRFHPTASDLERTWIASALGRRKNTILSANDAYVQLPLYDTLLASDGAVTVNSQAGLQAAWMGLPVLTLGVAFYAAKGFTIDLYGQSALLQSGVAAVLAACSRRKRSPAVVPFIDWLRREYLTDSGNTEELLRRLVPVSRDPCTDAAR